MKKPVKVAGIDKKRYEASIILYLVNEKEVIKISSNRNFGIIFFAFFLNNIIMAINKWWRYKIMVFNNFNYFFIFRYINSKLLTPLNNLWFKFGLLLGKIVSPIVMGAGLFLSCYTYWNNNEINCKRSIKSKKKIIPKPIGLKKRMKIINMKNQF